MATTEEKKRTLYRSIARNDVITNALKHWLTKICMFCQGHKLMSGSNNNDFSTYFEQVSDPTKMSGYIDLTAVNLQGMVDQKNSDYNQRTLLTAVYRFARIYAKFIWDAIYNEQSLDAVWTALGGVLDKDELRRHILFVLQKHGLEVENMVADPVSALKNTFIPRGSIDIFFGTTSYPSILTSITQPIGTDPVSFLMTGYPVHVRIPNTMSNEDKNKKRITEQQLSTYDCGLCKAENDRRANPQEWETGAVLYQVDQNSHFAKLANVYNKFTRCGPSCTTQMMLDCALLFDIDVYYVLLALLPWMELVKDHSLFEIALAANAYLPYDKYVVKPEAGPQKSDNHEYVFMATIYNRIFPGTNLPLAGGKRKKKMASKGGDANARNLPSKDDLHVFDAQGLARSTLYRNKDLITGTSKDNPPASEYGFFADRPIHEDYSKPEDYSRHKKSSVRQESEAIDFRQYLGKIQNTLPPEPEVKALEKISPDIDKLSTLLEQCKDIMAASSK